MLGDTSLQTVVANSILKKKYGLNLIKFSVWPILANIEQSQTLHSSYPPPPPHLILPTQLREGGDGGSIYSTIYHEVFLAPSHILASILAQIVILLWIDTVSVTCIEYSQ